MTTRLVLVSDTHTRHDEIHVPEGEILVCAGDFTAFGRIHEVEDFANWLRRMPHRHKIVIAGNHDLLFQSNNSRARRILGDACHYLQDSGVTVQGNNYCFSFYGTPWSPEFFDWAFNLPRGGQLRRYWDKIPPHLDVLVTHTPPRQILDLTRSGAHQGCDDLAHRIFDLEDVCANPRLHVFGHIHENAGVFRRTPEGPLFVNAAALDRDYRPTHTVRVVELDERGPAREVAA